MYNSSRQDYYFNQNCIASNVYKENYNDCRSFNFLVNKEIIYLTNGEFNINLKSDASTEDIENLISLPIPEVAYLSVSVREWNNNISNFLSNNNITSFKEVVFKDVNQKSVDVGLWMDGFIKISNKATGQIELYNQKIKSNLFAKFFTDLNYSYGKVL